MAAVRDAGGGGRRCGIRDLPTLQPACKREARDKLGARERRGRRAQRWRGNCILLAWHVEVFQLLQVRPALLMLKRSACLVCASLRVNACAEGAHGSTIRGHCIVGLSSDRVLLTVAADQRVRAWSLPALQVAISSNTPSDTPQTPNPKAVNLVPKALVTFKSHSFKSQSLEPSTHTFPCLLSNLPPRASSAPSSSPPPPPPWQLALTARGKRGEQDPAKMRLEGKHVLESQTFEHVRTC